LKLDLHLHSEYSWDSKVPIKDFIRLAEEKNFGAISITDHNNTTSHESIVELQNLTEVILIPGQEVTTLDGHLLVYGFIPSLDQKQTMKETVSIAKNIARETNQPVLTIAAHPFDRFRSGKGKTVITTGIDGFEVLNASTWFNRFNKIAQKESDKHKDLIFLGNSDSHRLSEFGTAYTKIKDVNTISEIFEKLQNGKVEGNIIGIRRKLIRFTSRKFKRSS